jgi:hypothetical protein
LNPAGAVIGIGIGSGATTVAATITFTTGTVQTATRGSMIDGPRPGVDSAISL